MAMTNPTGRVNYEPNSWGDEGGPRENAESGFRSYQEQVQGLKQRARSETFSDHYSQARQFYISQTSIEQAHIADAFVFELSKVEREDIRARMVSHLLNIDGGLAKTVAQGLGLAKMPKRANAAMPTREDLPASPKLSILRNGPDSFRGRRIGVLVTEAANAEMFAALKQAVADEGATLAVIAPTIGGVKASDGTHIPADEKIDGGPSVLFDAVVLITADNGMDQLAQHGPARDFVNDAFAHCKFIGYTKEALPLFESAGLDNKLDGGCVALDEPSDAAGFLQSCKQLRYWKRQEDVDKV